MDKLCIRFQRPGSAVSLRQATTLTRRDFWGNGCKPGRKNSAEKFFAEIAPRDFRAYTRDSKLARGNSMSETDGKTVTYTKEEFEALPPEAQNNIMMLGPKIRGRGVVRRADGTIKYDDESLAGSYDEDKA